MGILSFLLFGLVAGLVARAVTPGRQAIGCLPTLVLGVVGAFLGGLIGQVVLGKSVHAGWSLGPFLLAVVGAVVLLIWMMIAIPRYLWRHWTEPRLTAREQRRIAHRNGAAQLAARADLQNQWYLQGDPRGVYGYGVDFGGEGS